MLLAKRYPDKEKEFLHSHKLHQELQTQAAKHIVQSCTDLVVYMSRCDQKQVTKTLNQSKPHFKNLKHLCLSYDEMRQLYLNDPYLLFVMAYEISVLGGNLTKLHKRVNKHELSKLLQ